MPALSAQDIARTDGGRVQDPDRLYRPYRLEREGRSLDIVFRDRVLSDLIGFTYRSWAPQDAAANLMWRLREIRENVAEGEEPRLVTIALDGENAWEYYQDDGHEFLEPAVRDPGRRPRLPLRDRGRVPRREPTSARASLAPHRLLGLRRLLHVDRRSRPWPGMGSPPSRAGSGRSTPRRGRGHAGPGDARRREHAGRGSPARLVDVEEAWRHILIAEGSDWFWWFSTHQESGVDYLWDLAFRGHLQEAYRCLGESPPFDLFVPLLTRKSARESAAPRGRFTPVLDGRISSPDEWAQAGFHRAPPTGAMQTAEVRILDEVQFGSDQENLYLLLLPGREGFTAGTRMKVSLTLLSCVDGAVDTVCADQPPHELVLWVEGPGLIGAGMSTYPGPEAGGGAPSAEPHAVFDTVIEVALPLALLQKPTRDAPAAGDPTVRRSTRLSFSIATLRDDTLMELLPVQGSIDLDLG